MGSFLYGRDLRHERLKYFFLNTDLRTLKLRSNYVLLPSMQALIYIIPTFWMLAGSQLDSPLEKRVQFEFLRSQGKKP